MPEIKTNEVEIIETGKVVIINEEDFNEAIHRLTSDNHQEDKSKEESKDSYLSEDAIRQATIDAVNQLDKDNPDHWTGQDLPKVDAVAAILGRPTTRSEIQKYAPDATRSYSLPPGA